MPLKRSEGAVGEEKQDRGEAPQKVKEKPSAKKRREEEDKNC